MLFFFFFNDTATTEIYTLSLHDALPICQPASGIMKPCLRRRTTLGGRTPANAWRSRPFNRTPGSFTRGAMARLRSIRRDRKSTRLNSSHSQISYAVFCLKKKKNTDRTNTSMQSQQPGYMRGKPERPPQTRELWSAQCRATAGRPPCNNRYFDGVQAYKCT